MASDSLLAISRGGALPDFRHAGSCFPDKMYLAAIAFKYINRGFTGGAGAFEEMIVPDPQLALGSSNSWRLAEQWVADLLTGRLATTVAAIVVASAGLLLMQGRLKSRDCLRIVLGCFILFCASGIAKGLLGVTLGGRMAPRVDASSSAVSVIKFPPPSTSEDPFAGAALPQVGK